MLDLKTRWLEHNVSVERAEIARVASAILRKRGQPKQDHPLVMTIAKSIDLSGELDSAIAATSVSEKLVIKEIFLRLMTQMVFH